MWRLSLIVGLALLACESDPAEPAPVPDAAPVDASIPDAPPPPPCDPVLTAGTLVLARCDGGRTFELRRGRQVLLGYARVGLVVAGDRIASADYPEISWRAASPTSVEAVYTDGGRRPDLRLTLRLSAGGLRIELVAEGADGLPVEALLPLLAEVEAEDADAAHELDFPPVLVANASPAGVGLRVDIVDGALSATTTGPTASLLGPYRAPPVQIFVGDEPIALRRAQAAAMEVAVGAARGEPVWGARLPDGADAVAAGALLRGWATDRGVRSTPVVVVEPPPDPAALAEALSPARLGVRVAGDWNAAVPSERDAAARALAELAAQGVSWIELTLPGADVELRTAYGAARDAVGEVDLVAPGGGRALLGVVAAAGFGRGDDPAAARVLGDRWHYGERIVGLDLGPVHVAGRPGGEARRSAALRALSGGPYLLGDDPATLTEAEIEVFLAPVAAGLLGPAVPADDEDPPARWQSPVAAAWFNWTGAPRSFERPDGERLVVVPHDVVLLPASGE